MYKFVIGVIGIALAGFLGYVIFLLQSALPASMQPVAIGAVVGFVLIVVIWALSDDDNQMEGMQPR